MKNKYPTEELKNYDYLANFQKQILQYKSALPHPYSKIGHFSYHYILQNADIIIIDSYPKNVPLSWSPV